MAHTHRPDSNPDSHLDLTHNWSDEIDPSLLAYVPNWHRSFDDEPHVTAEALERLDADCLFSAQEGEVDEE